MHPVLINEIRWLSREEELELVARVWLKARNNRTQAVIDALSYPSQRTAFRRISDARKAGLLPPSRHPGV